jgi:3-oxoacyl-[acyl-carrier protein] reductase
MSEQTQKVAIVTGASRGIGAAIAERLGRDGFLVVVNYAGSASAAEDVVRKIEQAGGKAVSAQADVADAEAVRRMFDSAVTAYGGVDVLVNNAGIMMLAPLASADDAHFDRQVDVNLKGTFNTLREAARHLRNGGSVINFSTTVVGLKLETYGVYAATKAAVETLTAIMAKEMRGRDINVNAVAPGPTGTDLFLNGKSDELVERMSKMNPLERLGTPADIANVVSFLAGPDGAWINGQTLRANGGVI